MSNLRYPIAIEIGGLKKSWGVVVPDLPGCFSAADSGIDGAIENAKEAIELWIEVHWIGAWRFLNQA